MPDPSEETLNEMQRLLLLAALYHRLGPEIEIRASCGRVVGQALRWVGLWEEAIHDNWVGGDEIDCSDEWYGTLIAMIRHSPESEALFEGRGNFGSPDGGPPAAPPFTGCRLTTLGQSVAERLLERYPQYSNPG